MRSAAFQESLSFGMKSSVPIERITSKIYLIRGREVMPDRDLPKLYGVETKVLKQAVRRNSKRFPGDFMNKVPAYRRLAIITLFWCSGSFDLIFLHSLL